MRVRIVGDTEDLGLAEGQWDPNLGIDLCWEGDWVNGGMKLHNQICFFMKVFFDGKQIIHIYEIYNISLNNIYSIILQYIYIYI